MFAVLPRTLAPGQKATADLRRAPLVPVALAATAGIVLDRFAAVPLLLSLSAVVACLIAWIVSRAGPSPGLPLTYLLGGVAALGAAYHQGYRAGPPLHDIAALATVEPRPARLRGVLVEEPVRRHRPTDDPLRSRPRSQPTVAILQTTSYHTGTDWWPVQGRVRLLAEETLPELYAGDELEVVGRLMRPRGADNPGEDDPAVRLGDQRIRALFLVRQTADAVIRLREGWPTSFSGWLGVLRGWGQRQLTDALPSEQQGLATALLLGEGSALTDADWEKYKRTGVVHLLVISGQHLAILASFLGGLLWLAGVRRRHTALILMLVLLNYALLTGGRPPVMRAAVMVCTAAFGVVLGRTTLLANTFALAWLVVAAVNPTDMFTSGCQLSFLSVAVLIWGAGRWSAFRTDALERLAEESRPWLLRLLRGLGRRIVVSYAVALTIWLAAAPLIAFHYHVVAPLGVLLGPPLVLLVALVLVAGFLLLLVAALLPPAVPIFAWLTATSLAACDSIVTWAANLPGGWWYVGNIPGWWLGIFYVGLLIVLTLPPRQCHWRWLPTAALGWFCVGLIGGAARPNSDELRCTFLAVGHGGCTVLETADGRILLYDAGAMSGPELTQRHIAPFLWSRGVRRIDEIFLSHADLDHFNGLPALLERFALGQLSCTPTFVDRQLAGVRITLQALERARVPLRVVRAGDRLRAGDLLLEVLHPPASGPGGRENYRSLVLLLRHGTHRLLLTGDLEGPGLEQVLRQPLAPVDVLMAPHHGSRTANPAALADWARPRVVVSCEGPPLGPVRDPEPYTQRGSLFLTTWTHGAITIRSNPTGLWIETFRTRQQIRIREYDR